MAERDSDAVDAGVDQRDQVYRSGPGVAEPSRIKSPRAEELGGDDHEDRLVGIVEARQAEADVVKPQRKPDKNDKKSGGPAHAYLGRQKIFSSTLAHRSRALTDALISPFARAFQNRNIP